MHRPSARQWLAVVMMSGVWMTAVGCANTMIGGAAAAGTALSGASSVDIPGESIARSDESAAPAESVTVITSAAAPSVLTETVTVVPTPQAPSTSVAQQSPTSGATQQSPSPNGLPTDLAGEVYATVTSVNLANKTIIVDVLQWFTGQAAAAACAEDGVEPIGAVCSAYYMRNTNPQLRTLSLSPDIVITVNPESDPANATKVRLSGLANRIGESSGAFFRILVEDGQVVTVDEVFVP